MSNYADFKRHCFRKLLKIRNVIRNTANVVYWSVLHMTVKSLDVVIVI